MLPIIHITRQAQFWRIVGLAVVLLFGAFVSWIGQERLCFDQFPAVTFFITLFLFVTGFVAMMVAVSLRQDPFQWIAGIYGVLTISAFLSWLYWEDLHSDQESLSATIRNIGLIVGGIVAMILAVWRSTVAERQADTAQQSLLNERYERGADMLGSNVLSVRLAGIYALRRLAEENLEKYHVQIMRLLCAFVRHPTKDNSIELDSESQKGQSESARKLRADVEDAMQAIGSRSLAGISLENSENFKLYLRDANLSDLQIQDAKLSNAWLTNANLSGGGATTCRLVGCQTAAYRSVRRQVVEC